METGNKIMTFLNFDVWGFISKKYNISPKRKFDIFMYSVLFLSAFLDQVFIKSYFRFFTFTLISIFVMFMNEKVFYDIKGGLLWEIFLGVFLILLSFTIVSYIKWFFYPNTKVFGVFNGGMLILGYTISFYGLRKIKDLLPFYGFYGSLVLLNSLWGTLVGNFAEIYISPISSNLAYKFLVMLGYPAKISGTTITILTNSGASISATVAGACSGVEGVILFSLMIVGLFIGTKIEYSFRFLLVFLGAIVIFFINILRLSLIFIFAYYYGMAGFNIGHHWLGDILFLAFVLGYWFLIDRKISPSVGEKSGI